MQILAAPAFSNEKVNPYNSLLYREMDKLESDVNEYTHKKALLEKFNVVHFHWPDGYINKKNFFKSLQRVFLFASVITLAKLKGSKIVWTVHNVAPHDAYRPQLSKHFMNWFIKRCDGLIFMSDESKSTFLNLYSPPKTIQYTIIPHGHYRNSYPPAIGQAQAKAQLGLPQDKKVLLSLGMIKPYKNIDGLINIFNTASLDGHVLVVAGNPDSSELADTLKKLKANNPNIYLFLKFIPDNEINIYLSAADAVILPYKSILNSGALLLSLSFNKPTIAPHMGTIIGLQRELGTEWVYSFKEELDKKSLTKALSYFDTAERLATCPLDNYNWDQLAQATLNFYKKLA